MHDNLQAQPILEVRNLKKYFKVGKRSYLHAVDDISFEISTSEISEGTIHAFSDSVFKEKLNNSYRVEQTVLMDKSCLRESIFEKDLPCSFGGQFDYKFTYTVQGREKPDTVAFTTAKKI